MSSSSKTERGCLRFGWMSVTGISAKRTPGTSTRSTPLSASKDLAEPAGRSAGTAVGSPGSTLASEAFFTVVFDLPAPLALVLFLEPDPLELDVADSVARLAVDDFAAVGLPAP